MPRKLIPKDTNGNLIMQRKGLMMESHPQVQSFSTKVEEPPHAHYPSSGFMTHTKESWEEEKGRLKLES